MKNGTKWIAYGAVILVLALVALFIVFYPQFDRGARQAIRDLRADVPANGDQTSSTDGSEAGYSGIPTAAPEALASGLRGIGETIHDRETMGEGTRDYTLNRIDVYNTISESPIPLSECIQSTSYDTYATWKFVLLDMDVTNTSDSEIEPHAGEDYQFMLDLIPRSEADSQMLYFSEHPDNKNSDSDYLKFNLGAGETMNFKLGIFIRPAAWEAQCVYLQVGYDNESGAGFSYFS